MDELLATLRVLALHDPIIAAFVTCHDIDRVPLEHVVIDLIRTVARDRRTLLHALVAALADAEIAKRVVEMQDWLLAEIPSPPNLEPSHN